MTTRHRHSGHRRTPGGLGFISPLYVIAEDCDPLDPYCQLRSRVYGEMAEFGDDLLTAVVNEDGLWTALENSYIATLGLNDKTAALYDGFREDMLGWKQASAALKASGSGWFGTTTDEDRRQVAEWEKKRAAWAKDLEAASGQSLPTVIHNQQTPIDATPKNPFTPYLVGGSVALGVLTLAMIATRR